MDLFVTGPIENQLVNKCIRKILTCQDDTIVVYVNSEGGDPRGGLAIHQALRFSGCHIVTVAIKEIYSSAMMIYLAGDDRYATNFSHFLIHEVYHAGHGEISATAADYRRGQHELERESDTMFKFICQNSRLTMAKLKKEIATAPDHDWFFDTATAQKCGIVTHIGYPRKAKRHPGPLRKGA